MKLTFILQALLELRIQKVIFLAMRPRRSELALKKLKLFSLSRFFIVTKSGEQSNFFYKFKIAIDVGHSKAELKLLTLQVMASTEDLDRVFSPIVVILALVGILINSWAFVMLHRKNRKSHFHQLLKFLSIYDILGKKLRS